MEKSLKQLFKFDNDAKPNIFIQIFGDENGKALFLEYAQNYNRNAVQFYYSKLDKDNKQLLLNYLLEIPVE